MTTSHSIGCLSDTTWKLKKGWKVLSLVFYCNTRNLNDKSFSHRNQKASFVFEAEVFLSSEVQTTNKEFENWKSMVNNFSIAPFCCRYDLFLIHNWGNIKNCKVFTLFMKIQQFILFIYFQNLNLFWSFYDLKKTTCGIRWNLKPIEF